MNSDLVLGALLRRSMRVRLEPISEDVALDPIDFATLRALSGRAPVEPSLPEVFKAPEPLRRAA
jgi:hypothetical protein